MVVWFELMPLAAVDVGDNVLSSRFRGEVRCFDDLRQGLAFLHQAGDVADDIDEWIFRGFEFHVAVDAVALACGKPKLARKTRTLDTACPDECFGFDDLAALEEYLAGLGADNRGVEHDIAAALLQIFLGFGAQRFFENGENRRQRLDVENAHFLRVEEVFAAHDISVIEQLADHFDTGKARARDHKRQQLFSLFRVGLERSLVEFFFYMLAHFHCIFE